ncbi:hypothetical protein VTN77DRAFT_930 [Rasamsonia byssochlamydoides]|uniref:uncharacterized protein n=1 Tax=Rasamsonia byssochlamydoides TaxID=89139 RepID=UPI003742DC16
MARLSLRHGSPDLGDDAGFLILNDFVQPSSALSAVDVASRINQLLPLKDLDRLDTHDVDKVEGFLWAIWDTFIHVAKQIPHDHPAQQRLVQVIVELTQFPPVVIKLWGVETRIWNDLPLLGASMREAWAPPTSDAETVSQESAAEWRSLNSFAARMMRTGLVQWTNFAIWTMRDALEQQNPPGPVLDCAVATASEWIIHSHEVLFKQCANGDFGSEGSQSTLGGPLYNGNAGLSLDRWQFWKQRFRELSEQVNGQVKQDAADAADNM